MTRPAVLCRLGALDLDRAAALHAEAFVPFGERAWTRQDMAELLASPGVAGLLLQVEGADAGLAICRVVADEAELITLAVRPAHRRRGAARRLLAVVIDDVRAAGAKTLFLEVAADNPAAQALYKTTGFRIAGSRPAYFRRGGGPAADAVVMRLDLS
ncbi:MAG: ribosomal protein S18-alanine N-acetyltransferase [Reyranella sp.]|nr:ribosomal protein S18-alanine N-acetyltransferase [Reyranella sp.]MDP3162552.1 ribosomal protein S18-alanine N-acetyltransferase [Reyranella sp.]